MTDLERAADAIEAEWYLAGPPKPLPPKPPPEDDLDPEKAAGAHEQGRAAPRSSAHQPQAAPPSYDGGVPS